MQTCLFHSNIIINEQFPNKIILIFKKLKFTADFTHCLLYSRNVYLPFGGCIRKLQLSQRILTLPGQ